MADWWMGDSYIEVSYRTAKDKVEQVRVLAELAGTTPLKAAEKLVDLGTINWKTADEILDALNADKRGQKTIYEFERDCQEGYDMGYSDSLIAKTFGASKERVRKWRIRNNLPKNSPSLGIDGKWR